jgi:EAL domain-containing protein (putative c-di-GMP-specific phosphodiesterase class I)
VLEQALDDALEWQEKGFPIGVAVNVSASLLADHCFIEQVGQIVSRGSRCPPSNVTIEVTETAAMHSPERAIAALKAGASSASASRSTIMAPANRRWPISRSCQRNELKIDKSFVQTTVESDKRIRNMMAHHRRAGCSRARHEGEMRRGVEDAACPATARR